MEENYSLGEKRNSITSKKYLSPTQASNGLVHCPAFNELKKYGKACFSNDCLIFVG